ncbi:MAG: aspartate dehydrogenase [Candidatus Micrarchaeota archaeon]|nr:aspartate dehydrogenase [Candidatus Micrarchaeota archaeon]
MVVVKVGIIGLGNIGSFLAKRLQKEVLWAVDNDARAKKRAQALGLGRKFSFTLPKKCGGADLVVECASQEAVPLLLKCLPYCDVMVMSVGALADRLLCRRLVRTAKKYKRRIFIPSGAIGGLDAISSLQGELKEVLLETTKPPASLGRSDAQRVVVFEGNAMEACQKYPQNINVSATLALAGLGFEKTKVRIISDPEATKNRHRIVALSSQSRIVVELENEPMPGNPKTSALAALSALKRIRKTAEAMQIG